MKYRIIKRAKGWLVQRYILIDTLPIEKWEWQTITAHRFHFLAKLHLLVLREWWK